MGQQTQKEGLLISLFQFLPGIANPIARIHQIFSSIVQNLNLLFVLTSFQANLLSEASQKAKARYLLEFPKNRFQNSKHLPIYFSILFDLRWQKGLSIQYRIARRLAR